MRFGHTAVLEASQTPRQGLEECKTILTLNRVYTVFFDTHNVYRVCKTLFETPLLRRATQKNETQGAASAAPSSLVARGIDAHAVFPSLATHAMLTLLKSGRCFLPVLAFHIDCGSIELEGGRVWHYVDSF